MTGFAPGTSLPKGAVVTPPCALRQTTWGSNPARRAARACARSNLLKCALHGEDPNWGRILSVAGTTTATFAPDQVDVMLNGVVIARNGSIGDDRSLVDMSGRTVVIEIDLKAGEHAASVWTNDLTATYVHENSAYST